MKLAPVNYFPPDTQPVVYNGAPTFGSHIRDLDRLATWLAARVQVAHPWMTANYWSAGSRYELVIRVPQFVAHVGWQVMATGRGTITVSNTPDSYDADILVEQGDGTSHTFADAALFEAVLPMQSVSQDGELRALDVTFSKEPAHVYHDWQIVDAGGGATCRVYAIRPVWVQLTEEDDLSTAA